MKTVRGKASDESREEEETIGRRLYGGMVELVPKLTVTTSARSLGKNFLSTSADQSQSTRISGTCKNFQSNHNPRNAFALVFA